jgi:two-component system, cell cycle response regulator
LSASEPSQGHVLLLTDDHEASERLARWIATAGHDVVALTGSEKFLLNEGDDERVNLVVTDLDSDDPAARALLDRLLGGDLFRSIPQLHVFRDLALMRTVRQANPALTGFSIPAPAEAEDFQARVRLAAEIGRLGRELARHSIRDGLTALLNRRYLLLRLEEEFSRARRHRTPISLVFIDIDHLKEINDGHGQAAGDAAIRRVGQIIRTQVRREDVMGRIGEDVFGVVLIGNRYRGAAVMANKIRTEAEDATLQHAGAEIAIRVSAGISTYPDNRTITSPDDLVRTAEDALAQAKARGGNRVFIDEGVLRQERRVILVADPDADLLDLTEDLLALDDFRVVKASSARTALETLRFRRPDLLVLDLGMLEEDGGVPLIERIQHMYPGSRFPIIGLSQDGGVDPDRLQRLGVDRFITKPFSLSLLRSAARELLEAYRT